MKCDENYEKLGGYMFFGGQIHLVHDTKWDGVVGPLKFSKIPLSDHGVYLKGLKIPLQRLFPYQILSSYFKNCMMRLILI